MHVPAEVKALVNARIVQCYALAEAHYGQTFEPVIVVYRKRGTTAGTAQWSNRTIDLNSIILMENQDDFIARTVGHEVAHILDKDIHGHRRTASGKRDSHGAGWKSVMRVLGQDPSRCHSYDVTNAKVRKSNNRVKHIWTCGCGETSMELGDKRHNHQSQAAARGDGCFYMRNHKWTRCGHYTYTHVLANGVKTAVAAQPAPVVPATPKLPAGWERISTSTLPRVTARAAQTVNRADPTFNRVPALAGNKLEKSTQLYRENYGVSRKVMMQLFVEEAGCTPAGAGTYYAKIKKALGG